MSDADVQVVRAYNEPYSGQDVIPVLERAVEAYEQGGTAAVDAAEPELSAVVDDEIEWDMGPAGAYRGRDGLLRYWREWIGMWESYVYEVRDYEDLGDTVLSVVDVRARGRQGIEVGMRVFQTWEVSDGRIVWAAAFNDRGDALRAAAARAH
jgi:hypothetical protein